MSTEQSEAEQSPIPPVEIGNSVAMTQQATTPTPTTAPRAKNPKRVAAGKAVAERTRLAREQQKKAAAEAAVIIANNKASGVNPTPHTNKTVADTQGVWGTPTETPKSTKVDNSSLSTHPMDWCYQHSRFTDRHLLQT